MRMKRRVCILLSAAILFASACAQTYCADTGESGILFNDAGEILCPAGMYDDILPVADGIFAAKTEEGWLLLDDDGRSMSDIVYEDVYEEGGFLLLKKDGLYALADLQLALRCAHAYTQIVSNGEGGFLALKTEPNDDRGDGVYLLDEDGNETTVGTVLLYGLNEFSCGRSVAVGSGGKRIGYIAPDGTWAINAQYGYGAQFVSEGLTVASVDSGVGLIDVDGNWIVSPKFECIELSEGNPIAAICTADGRIGLFDVQERKGIIEIPERGGYVRTNGLNGFALVTVNGIAALYGRDGSILNSWEESSGATVCMLGEMNILLYMDGAEYLLDLSAQTMAGPYERITLLEENLFAAQRQGACDLLDAEGHVLVETEYDRIDPAGGGFFLAWKGEKGMLVDRTGAAIANLDMD